MEEVWHYTGFDACLKILETKSLLLSRITDTNDGTDCDWVHNLLEDHFIEKLAANPSKSENRRLVATGNKKAILKGDIKVRLSALFGTLAKQASPTAFETFITCFSKPCIKNGDDGKLSMWRGYGKEKPVALVFNAEKLEALALKSFSGEDKPMMMFNDVIYARGVDELTGPFQNHLEVIESAFSTVDFTEVDIVGTHEFMGSLGTLAFATKHPGFFEEEEVRLAVVLPDPTHEEYKAASQDAAVEVIEGKRRYRWQIGDALFDCLEKIVLGPQMEEEAKKLKRYLKSIGRRITVVQSAIPLR
mgnify:CR=1 FL=1